VRNSSAPNGSPAFVPTTFPVPAGLEHRGGTGRHHRRISPRVTRGNNEAKNLNQSPPSVQGRSRQAVRSFHSPNQTVSTHPPSCRRQAGGRADFDAPSRSPPEPLRCWGVGGGSPPRRRGFPKGRAFGPSAAGGKARRKPGEWIRRR
jgi:hypothetical protein